jgi:hypothetical protein
VNPKARTVLMMALLAGIATGVGFVILAEVLDRIYRSSAQVARSLGLPVLDMIDEIVTAQDRRRIFLRRVVATPLILIVCGGLLIATGSLAYLSIQRPHAYEQIQRVPRAAIDYLTGTMPSPAPPGQAPRQTS